MADISELAVRALEYYYSIGKVSEEDINTMINYYTGTK